jgi:hypothetical protein
VTGPGVEEDQVVVRVVRAAATNFISEERETPAGDG